jgi:hypothetical protein
MLIYTLHARKRMLERRITEKEIDYCLQNYHTVYTDPAGNPIYRADLPDGRHIKVVLAAGAAEPRTVITVAD